MNNQKKIWRKHSQEVNQQVAWLKKNKWAKGYPLELHLNYEISRQRQKQRNEQKKDNMYNMHKLKPLKRKFQKYDFEDVLKDVENNGKNTLFPKNFYF